MATKIQQQDVEDAIADLSMLKFFPREPGTQVAIQRLLLHMCPHREALQWLVSTLVNHVGEWPGPKEMRALLCTHYAPADGIQEWCGIPGFRPSDYEAKHIEQSNRYKEGSWSPEALELLAQVKRKRLQ